MRRRNTIELILAASLPLVLLVTGCAGASGANAAPTTIIVKTEKELLDAIIAPSLGKHILVDGSFTVANEFSTAANVTVNKGAVLMIEARQCYIDGALENNGEIVVSGTLQLKDMMAAFPGKEDTLNPTGTGVYSVDGGEIAINTVLETSADIEKFFNERSPLNSIVSTPGVKTTLLIDKDTEIPAGHKIWLNAEMTLKVAEGVTLTNLGTIETFNEPIIDGVVVGNIVFIK